MDADGLGSGLGSGSVSLTTEGIEITKAGAL